ncbi:MAG: hypothetical protein KDC13_08335, partial [Bacteroidetes bacterium]|nr:hypothetical protein [Bacteroidota bacterium]
MRQIFLLFVCFILSFQALQAQTACGIQFTDPGGAGENYLPGIFETDTLFAEMNQQLSIDFTEWGIGENDTLWLFDPYFYSQTVIALTQSSAPVSFTSYSSQIGWIFNATGTEGGTGWIADISCNEFLAAELQIDTLCAGFEGFVPWMLNAPFSDTTWVIAQLSADEEFLEEIIALGENQVTSDSFYLQLGTSFE